MNKITKHNYEAYLLDYSEQLLSAEDVAELLLFIELNPDLEIALEHIDLAYLQPTENSNYGGKDFLKNLPRIETLAIGNVEQILDNEEQEELTNLIKEFPAAEGIISDYTKTILPKENIIFPNKKSLKRTRTIPLFWPVAVAASLIGFIVFFGSENATPIYSSSTINLAIEKYNPSLNLNENIAETNPAPIDSVAYNSKEKKPDNNYTPKQELAITPIIPEDDDTLSSIKIKQKNEDVILPQELNIAEVIIDTVPSKGNFEELSKQDDDIDIASTTSSASSAPMTIGQFIKGKAKEIVVKDQDLNNENVLASLASGINAKTKMDVAYASTESDDKKVTKFKLGKVEFYRSSSK
jgi:hypothetical protein